MIRRHEARAATRSATLLHGPAEEAAAKLEKLLAQQRELEKRIAELQGKLAGGATRDLLADARRVDGVTVLATRVEGLDDKGLREMADRSASASSRASSCSARRRASARSCSPRSPRT